MRSPFAIEQELTAVESRLGQVQSLAGTVPGFTPTAAVVSTLPPVINLLRDSDCNFSQDGYDNDPPVVGDLQHQAAYIYHNAQSATELFKDAAHSLKDSGHSLYAADATAWDKTNGHVLLGNTDSIGFPLRKKYITPSQVYYFGFICRLEAGVTLPDGTSARLGLYDNTAGQRKYIEGGAFSISGAVRGVAGTTQRKFKVIAQTDWGWTYESNEITLNTTNAVLSTANFVELTWLPIIGVTKYDVYRLDVAAAIYSHVYEIRNGTPGYDDRGTIVTTVTGYPSTTTTKPKAYLEIPNFQPSETEWKPFVAAIAVPDTYDTSLTTGEQWALLSLSNAPSAARGLKLDKFFLSRRDGVWAESSDDSNAKQDVATTMSSSNQGGVGVFDRGGETPEPGTGSERFRQFENP